MTDVEFLTQSVTRGLTEILMAEHGMSLTEALNVLRNSKTFSLLTDEETRLYRESPSYVYEILRDELESGRG